MYLFYIIKLIYYFRYIWLYKQWPENKGKKYDNSSYLHVTAEDIFAKALKRDIDARKNEIKSWKEKTWESENKTLEALKIEIETLKFKNEALEETLAQVVQDISTMKEN